jgi:hypothetical protein
MNNKKKKLNFSSLDGIKLLSLQKKVQFLGFRWHKTLEPLKKDMAYWLGASNDMCFIFYLKRWMAFNQKKIHFLLYFDPKMHLKYLVKYIYSLQ